MQPPSFSDFRQYIIRASSNKSTFLLPPIQCLPDPKYIPARRELTPKEFIVKALKGVQCDGCQTQPASIRSAVLQSMNKAIKDPSLHFNRCELSILFNIYFHLTNHENRPMEQRELAVFLYLTFNITNTATLEGIYRAALKITHGGFSKQAGGFDSYVFVKMLSALLRGSIEERAVWTFYILDEDGDDAISPKLELTRSLRHTFDPTIAASAPEIDPEEPFRDTLRYLTGKMGMTLTGSMSLEEFVRECKASPWLIEGIAPTLPSEITNYAFQSIITQTPRLPPIENITPRCNNVSNEKKRRKKE
ncbi:unnamed protein product [Mesocestoides corti]|uniref:EF-hand domain-containing protein n=1 Tax=Mesocestoides corti TaxID=53468 RepID=A0A0R3U833_MESCO|nr:unnamed protein product [Mesocestoides corti]